MIANALSFVMWWLQNNTTGLPPSPEMTTGGWIFMGGAWLCILSLVYYTFSKILRGSRK